MSKKVIVNKFNGGVTTDLDESVIAPTALSNAHNMRLTSNRDHQFILQKEDGRSVVVDGYPSDLIPIAVKEYNDTAYFVSHNTTENKTEYGMFPAPNITEELLTPVEGYDTNAPTITNYGAILLTISGDTAGILEVPSVPSQYKEFTVTNESRFLSVTIQFRFDIELRDGTGATSSIFDRITIDPEETKTFRISGGDDTVPVENAPFQIEMISATLGSSTIYNNSFLYRTLYITTEYDPWYLSVETYNSNEYEILNQEYARTDTLGTPAVWSSNDASGDVIYLRFMEAGGKRTIYRMDSYPYTNTFVDKNSNEHTISFDIEYNAMLEINLLHIESIPETVVAVFVQRDVEGALDFPEPPVFESSVGTSLTEEEEVDAIQLTRIDFVSGYELKPEYYLKLHINAADWVGVDSVDFDVSTNSLSTPTKTLLSEKFAYFQNITNNNIYGFTLITYYGATPTFRWTYDLVGVQNVTGIPKIQEYRPLYNYKTDGFSPLSLDYKDPFRVDSFGYTQNSVIDVEIQPSYDGSVNIITACEGKHPRIVNSRVDMSAATANIIIRSGGNLENVYSDDDIDKTRLIPKLGDIVVDLDFLGTFTGGSLEAGGYKYFFKLLTSDGVESELIEQSRLVSVHFGSTSEDSYTSNKGSRTDKQVKFKIKDITNNSFSYVQVYYTKSIGSTDSTTVSAYKIVDPFPITLNGECYINHTGREVVEEITATDIVTEYLPIESVKTITQKNGRLLLGNVNLKDLAYTLLKEQALQIYVSTSTSTIFNSKQPLEISSYQIEETYANPTNSYKYLGYHPGETYEIGVNYVFSDGRVSDTFPIIGRDFNTDISGFDIQYGEDFGWIAENGVNSKGVVRTTYLPIEVAPVTGYIKSYTMRVEFDRLDTDALAEAGVTSIFISRRERIPDKLFDGIILKADTIPLVSASTVQGGIYNCGTVNGVPIESLPYLYMRDRNPNGTVITGVPYSIVPTPAGAMPYSAELLRGGGSFDMINYAGPYVKHDYFAFYTPDVSDPNWAGSRLDVTANRSLYLNDCIKITHESRKYADVDARTLAGAEQLIRSLYTPINYSISTGSYGTLGIKTAQFVPDGYRNYMSGKFTSRSDRQANLFTYPFTSRLGFTELFTNPLSFTNSRYSFEDALVAANEASGETGLSNYTAYTYEAISKLSNYIGSGTEGKPINETGFGYINGAWLSSNVTYLPYIGIEVNRNDVATAIHDALKYPEGTFVKYTCKSGYGEQHPADAQIAALVCSMYGNAHGTYLPLGDWIERYNTNREDTYFPVTKRLRVNSSLDFVYLTGGDCFVGYQHQQIWRPGGVDGVPTASSPKDYVDDRTGTGLTDSGMSITYPTRSSINFFVRAKSDGSESEMSLYKQQRDRLRYKDLPNLRSIKRPETEELNYGNFIEDSISAKPKFDESVPFLEIKQPNRIYVSDAADSNTYKNGYRNFKGLSFRDYDPDLGYITSILSYGLYTYIIYSGGVSIIEVLERSAVQTSSENSILIGNAGVIPEKSSNIFSFLGSRYPHSIVSTEHGIFGVDTDRKKVWKVMGNAPAIVSDTKVQKLLNDYITDTLINVITTHNKEDDIVAFMFKYENGDKVTLSYNAKLDVWNGTSTSHSQFQFLINQKSYMIDYDGSSYNIIHSVPDIKNVTIDATGSYNINSSYLEFVVSDETDVKFMLDNMIINGRCVPDSIDIIPEDGESYELGELGIGTYIGMPCHTNMFVYDLPGSSITEISEYKISFNNSVNKTVTYKAGDLITLQRNNQMFKHKVSKVEIVSNTTTLTLARSDGSEYAITALYYGWKVPLRLSLMEVDKGQTKISIPTKLHTMRLAAQTVNETLSVKNRYAARPSGRWIKIRMNFNGTEPVYIESIISIINLLYS